METTPFNSVLSPTEAWDETDSNNTESGEETNFIIGGIQFGMTVIGFIGNVVVFITLSKNGSVFTNPSMLRLLKNQSVADSIVCLLGSIFVFQPIMWKIDNKTFDILVCQVSSLLSAISILVEA